MRAVRIPAKTLHALFGGGRLVDAKSGIYPEVLRYEALSLMKIDIYISIFVVYLCSMINTFSFFLGDLKGSLIEDVCDIRVELVFIPFGRIEIEG